MESKNLFLFVIIALAALFIISTFSGTKDLTGRTAERGAMTCSDNDGYNIYMKGYVTTFIGGRERQYWDRCSGGNGLRMMENYCDDNRRAFAYEWCPNGQKCSDGQCVTDTSSRYYGGG